MEKLIDELYAILEDEPESTKTYKIYEEGEPREVGIKEYLAILEAEVNRQNSDNDWHEYYKNMK